MQPVAMALLLIVTLGIFAWSASRRWALMMAARRPDNRTDQMGARIGSVLTYVFGQKRMPRYSAAGWAHVLVFFGFCVLLLNSIMLWVRGFVGYESPAYDLWILGVDQPLGMIYAFLRDVFIMLVIVGVVVFFWNRVVLRLSRLTLNVEGLIILGIIFVMMAADLVYEGVEINKHHGGEFIAAMPFSSLVALVVGESTFLYHAGFWTHAALVLIFLNLLPYGKHFHVLTVIPNVFARSLTPRGRIDPIEDIEGRLEREETLGVKAIKDLSWKDVLDFYTCTECGRCSDQCPATSTGKELSPKHFSIALRDHMYENQSALIASRGNGQAGGNGQPDDENVPFTIVPEMIKPEVLWACTTCSACEEECPVFITYIDKIVGLRQHLVMEQGEFPEQLQTMLQGIENAGNPYSYPNDQRAEWAEGLDVPIMAEGPEDIEYLYWVGCAASFDDRSRKIAQAFAQLMNAAGVKFAILGPEEMCNGDPARRAGNEFLFQMMAQQNIETLNGYNVKRIVTACPHCYNTLKHEYPDFGGKYEVIHHSELLAQLVRQGRLKPHNRVDLTIAYHDACYLGRHNDIYDPPREILRAIPGVRLLEPEMTRDRGMCCGAGGAQMWKEEEEGRERVNHARTKQLIGTVGDGEQAALASACPFCKTMLTDSLADLDHEQTGQVDIAEILWQAMQPAEKPATEATA